jgi:hypothetical protein
VLHRVHPRRGLGGSGQIGSARSSGWHVGIQPSLAPADSVGTVELFDGVPMRQSSSIDTTRADFDAAFPWFNHERWMWSFDPGGTAGIGYRILGASREAYGRLVIYMPGATYEQGAAVKAWLMERFNPAYIVPPDPQFVQPQAPRPGQHNSTFVVRRSHAPDVRVRSLAALLGSRATERDHLRLEVGTGGRGATPFTAGALKSVCMEATSTPADAATAMSML